MTDRGLTSLGKAAVASLGVAVGVTALVSPKATLGVAVGGAWSLASLWCLTRLLASWLGPQRSTRQVVGWLVVKFPLLYLLAFWLMRRPAVSFLGFGVGFSVVLVTAIAGLAIHARRIIPPPAAPLGYRLGIHRREIPRVSEGPAGGMVAPAPHAR